MNDVIFCSIGENCLTQDVLDRHELRSIVGPFSWVRSNIEYVLEIIAEEFSNLLNPVHLQYRERYGKKIVTNSRYQSTTGKFEKSVSDEFEFTHHDVIGSSDERESFKRKQSRFQDMLRSEQSVVFVYHHRYNGRQRDTINHAVAKLSQFAETVRKSRSAPVSILCFTQNIVSGSDSRRVERSDNAGCRVAVLHTSHVWGGNDPNIFWGRNDDDLFAELFSEYRGSRSS